MTTPNSLNKNLRERHINMIALGGTIGSSYFLGSGYLISQMGPSSCLAYLLGGIITFLVMACFAELILARPSEGFFINYAKIYISPAWGSGVGWSYWISWIVFVPSECIAGGILMHHFLPSTPIYAWTLFFGVVISLINLMNVKAFGEFEYFLSWIKLIIIFVFSFLAILIFFGLVGNNRNHIIGDAYFLKNGSFFAKGIWIFLGNLVIMLSNFQGTEIIGITAAETSDPKKNVPSALKKITIRLLLIYLVPTFLLVLIFPWQKANLQGSIFAIALSSYGLTYVGHLISFFVIAAAISCANSGLYSTTRSLYALALKGYAPKSLKTVNSRGVPIRASMVSLGAIWIILIFSCFLPAENFYANLLALTGFTGAIAWISICVSQYYFRRKYQKKAEKKKPLFYAIPFFPYLTHISIWLQVICLLVMAISPQLRYSFYFSIPAVFIPMCWYKIFLYKKRRD